MEIITKRLLLREFAASDEPALAACLADPRVTQFYGPDEPPDLAGRLVRQFMAWAAEVPRRNYQFAIADVRAPQRLIGNCGLRTAGLAPGQADFGLELAPERWRQGYATEAAQALLAFGFTTLGLDEVRGRSVSANTAVASLVWRLGFTLVGTPAGPAWLKERGWCQHEWLLTRKQWQRMVADC